MAKKGQVKLSSTEELRFLKVPGVQKEVSTAEVRQIAEVDYPLFSFRWLQDYSIDGCRDAKFFHDVLMRMQKLSELGWDGIRRSARHSFGMESIPVGQIKPKVLPQIITPDVKNLHVLRAVGDNRPMVGLQHGKIFHVIFLEANFGDVYNHG